MAKYKNMIGFLIGFGAILLFCFWILFGCDIAWAGVDVIAPIDLNVHYKTSFFGKKSYTMEVMTRNKTGPTETVQGFCYEIETRQSGGFKHVAEVSVSPKQMTVAKGQRRPFHVKFDLPKNTGKLYVFLMKPIATSGTGNITITKAVGFTFGVSHVDKFKPQLNLKAYNVNHLTTVELHNPTPCVIQYNIHGRKGGDYHAERGILVGPHKHRELILTSKYDAVIVGFKGYDKLIGYRVEE